MHAGRPSHPVTYAAPLAQLLVLRDGDEVHVVLSAQGLNQLLVVGLVAVLSQQAQLGLALLDGPAAIGKPGNACERGG